MADRPTNVADSAAPDFTDLCDLASELVGGEIIFATDDWFATAENLLQSAPPVFKDGVFTEYGKWMDGWETRRKRIPGHDWCIIKLGAPGRIVGLDIDTSFFTGNYAPRASLQAACLTDGPVARSGDRMGTAANDDEMQQIKQLKSDDWEVVLPMTSLGSGYKDTCHNYLSINCQKRFTHVRLNIFPDGGVARLRVYGHVYQNWSEIPNNQLVDLASLLNGGTVTSYSNAHYGHARNVICPGRARVMAEGWETARRLDRPAILEANSEGILQVPGCEWAEFKLGHPGVIEKIEIDTNHFKGNFPDSCYIEGKFDQNTDKPDCSASTWRKILSPKKLTAHAQHYYTGSDINAHDAVSHVRLVMAPDGGISRMRLWGRKQ